MDGDQAKQLMEHELATWQRASSVCHDKLAALEALSSAYRGADTELLEVLVERERDVCAQLRARIALKSEELATAAMRR